MAATVNSDIRIKPTQVYVAVPGDSSARRPSSAGIAIAVYHPAGHGVFRHGTRHALLLSTASTSANSLFHAGCAAVTERADDGSDCEVLYTTSGLLQTVDSSQLPVVLITRIAVQRTAGSDGSDDNDNSISAVSWAKLRPPPSMPTPGAMLPYSVQSRSGILYCVQGTLAPRTSGLFFMPHGRRPQPLVDSFYGTDFNSVRDVAVHPRDGALWFTDPHTGFDSDIRNEPQLPNHIYRTDLSGDPSGNPSGEIAAETRVMDDSLQRPTSLCFSPDGHTLYVSDTFSSPESHANLNLRPNLNLSANANANATSPGVRSVYAFDVVERGAGVFLANRRLFAYTLQGAPQCIRADHSGNVFVASGSRIEVRSVGGSLLAALDVPGPGSVSSFCFTTAACDEMYVCAGQELWWVKR